MACTSSASGNQTSRDGSTISYTSYNLPGVINAGSASSTLSYGAYRNRYKQVSVSGGMTETTISIAGLLEKVTKSGVTEYRHRVGGASGVVAIYTRRSSGSPAISTYYVLRDHLGSPETITDGGGGVLAKLSFAAYGERRDATDWEGAISAGSLATLGAITREGYTGHGQLDAVGLVHMEGRIYDPVIGRFLSRDPLLALGHGQGPNGYAYTWNNPLRYVDPTGYATEAVENVSPEDWCIDGSCTTIVNGVETITVNSSAPRDTSSTATRPLPPGSVQRRWGGGGAGEAGGRGHGQPIAAAVASLYAATEGELLFSEILYIAHEGGVQSIAVGVAALTGVGIGLGVREASYSVFGETPGAALYELTHRASGVIQNSTTGPDLRLSAGSVAGALRTLGH